MSIGEIARIALTYTALGMGTVFVILIFISLCIWIMGILCRERKPAALPAAEAEPEPDGVQPEVVAAITAALHEKLKEENPEDEYVVRNVRRASWKHTS